MAALNVKRRVALFLGDRRWRRLKALRDKFITEPRLRHQRMVPAKVGKITVKAPRHHPVTRFAIEQPYRDLPVGFAAEAVARKYPGASFVDIGANIGDTAAMMATYAPNPLILVEASRIYQDILRQNVAMLPNVRRIEFVFVSTESTPPSGRLRHWGGTAAFEPNDEQTIGPTKRLSEVADDDTMFIKIDTDGFDFAILRSSTAWLAHARPLVLFESDVPTQDLHRQALETLDALIGAGYRWFVVWDDRGYHMTTTDDIGVLRELHTWLHTRRQTMSSSQAVSNFDILCAVASDWDVVDAVTKAYLAMSS